MFNLLANALLAVNFTTYPALGDRPPAAPREVQATAQIEAMVDRGPIVEMILRCPSGTAIISYSKIERRYCGPAGGCDGEISRVVMRACAR